MDRRLFFAVIAAGLSVAKLNSAFDIRTDGSETSIKSHPHHVAIFVWKGHMGHLGAYGSWKYVCGGSIIHELWVLTAGQCVTDLDKETTFETDYVAVIAGNDTISYLWKATTWPNFNEVELIIVHPSFQMKTKSPDDIALIKLKRLLQFDETIQPARLPMYYDEKNITEFTFVGFGYKRIYGDKSEDKLRKVTLKMTSKEECAKIFSEYLANEKTFCVTGPAKNSTNLCKDGIGGGFVNRMANNYWPGVVLGVAMWQLPHCEMGGFVQVVMDVASYIPWIREAMTN